MSVITDKKGQTAEAFDLIMRKEFAYEILKGNKTIEYRDFTQFYAKRFCSDVKELKRKPIYHIHFHDYNNTWFLDVAIESVDICAVDCAPETRFYFESYGDTTMEEALDIADDKQIKIDDKEALWTFCMPITAIINTNLDTRGLNVELSEIM